MNLADINTRAAIATSLAIIAFVLVYAVFLKGSKTPKLNTRK